MAKVGHYPDVFSRSLGLFFPDPVHTRTEAGAPHSATTPELAA